jgi:hypothetical protein
MVHWNCLSRSASQRPLLGAAAWPAPAEGRHRSSNWLRPSRRNPRPLGHEPGRHCSIQADIQPDTPVILAMMPPRRTGRLNRRLSRRLGRRRSMRHSRTRRSSSHNRLPRLPAHPLADFPYPASPSRPPSPLRIVTRTDAVAETPQSASDPTIVSIAIASGTYLVQAEQGAGPPDANVHTGATMRPPTYRSQPSDGICHRQLAVGLTDKRRTDDQGPTAAPDDQALDLLLHV